MNILPFKRCTKCGEWKPRSKFSPDPRLKSGLRSSCKVCSAAATQSWRERNPEKHQKSNLARALQWYQNHKEEVKEARRLRYERSQGKELEQNARWKSEHKEQHLEGSRRWQATHPDNVKARAHNRRARIKANGGRFTAQEWRALKEFYDFACLQCGKCEPEIKLTPDHVLPLKLGGTNSIDNIQPLCGTCNNKKGAKHIDYRRDNEIRL